MEKIILRNNQEFNVPPLGIIGNDLTKRRKITFVSDMDYNDVLALLSNKDNISQITYVIETGAVIATYTDCVALKSLSYDIDKGTCSAEFSTDATERLVHELQARVEQMQHVIDTLAVKEEPSPEPEKPEEPDEDPAEETPDEPTEDEIVEDNPTDEPTEEEPGNQEP